ncbi:hypothetical protein RKS98_005150 [Citrobacter freundii]|nr:hypothetical protein [Citrobacter freundii]ELD7994572.1 hypothetical protein [Citrobacter freundii]
MTTNNHPAHGPVSLDRLSLNDAIAHADERADALSGPCSAQHAQLAAWLRELQERRKADAVKVIDDAIAAFGAEPVAVNDDMAYAFHHALSDSSLGTDEVEEIKTGLRAAFANVTAPPAPDNKQTDELVMWVKHSERPILTVSCRVMQWTI